MTIDLEKIYRETPGKSTSIHLNNAGASLMSQPVLDAQIAHLKLEATIGGYEARAHRTKNIDGVYNSVAKLIGANADEIAIVELPDQSIWVSEARTRRQGRSLTAVADIVPPKGKPFVLDRSQLRFTVLGAGRGVDILGCRGS